MVPRGGVPIVSDIKDLMASATLERGSILQCLVNEVSHLHTATSG
jgi:hypothetical protein